MQFAPHARACARTQRPQRRPYPKLTSQPMALAQVFDCAVHPLYVRISDADVAGMWSFGVEMTDSTMVQRQAEIILSPDPSSS